MKNIRIVVVGGQAIAEPGMAEIAGTLHIRVVDSGNWRENVAAAVRALAEESLRRAGHSDPGGTAAEIASAFSVELESAGRPVAPSETVCGA